MRNAELGILWKTFLIDSTNVFLLNAIPTVVSVTTFLTFILMGNTLTAAKVCILCSLELRKLSKTLQNLLFCRCLRCHIDHLHPDAQNPVRRQGRVCCTVDECIPCIILLLWPET